MPRERIKTAAQAATEAATKTAVKTAIVGCGNPNRSDDGVGPEVARRLRQMALPKDIAVFDAGTDGMAVLYRARGVKRLIVVDAKAPEGHPGAIYEVPGELLQAPPPPSLNLHDFRWDHALYAGRKIYGDDFPAEVAVFLIEAETLDLGLGLSAAVAAAAARVADKIKALVIAAPASEAHSLLRPNTNMKTKFI